MTATPSWRTPRASSPATSCPRRSSSSSASSARPRARPTTAGPPRRRWRRRGRRAATGDPVIVTTPRLVLRPFTDMDRAPFYELNTHPLVVESLGQSPTRAQSDQLVDVIHDEMESEDFGLWAVEVPGGPPSPGWSACTGFARTLPVAPAVEVGLAPPSGPLGPRATPPRRPWPRCATASTWSGWTRSSHSPRRATPLAGRHGPHRHAP